MTMHTTVYLAYNIILAVAIWMFMKVFYDSKRTKKVTMLFTFVIYYVLSSVAFLLLNIPLVNLVVSSMCYFIITLNYESTIKRRLGVVLFVLIFVVSIEAIVFLSVSMYQPYFTAHLGYGYMIGFISNGVLILSTALLTSRLKNIKRDYLPSYIFILITVIIPALSTFVAITVFFFSDMPRVLIGSALGSMIGINYLMAYFHNKLSIAYEDVLKAQLDKQEKEYYYAQCRLMQESVDKMKLVRHDMKIHLAAILGLASKGNIDGVSSYIERILSHVKKSEIYYETGNLVLDSILNFKLGSIDRSNTDIDINVLISADLNFDAYNIATILGNLLDNALEAIERVEGNKWIKIEILESNDTLLVCVENPFRGTIDASINEITEITPKKAFLQSKKDGRGYGLRNIRTAVAENDGDIDIRHDNNVFTVRILMFID